MTTTPAPDGATLDLDAIQARADKATPGPWRTNEPLKTWIEAPNCCDRGPMYICDIRGWGHLTGRGHGAHAMDEASGIAVQEANSDFIKHAREDIPALLAEIRRLRSQSPAAEPAQSEVERLREVLKPFAALAVMGATFKRILLEFLAYRSQQYRSDHDFNIARLRSIEEALQALLEKFAAEETD